ncbi:MAG: prepilin-type N-terminal cleavage/methylation domain-containing protein [Lachnospiraceae bacterium]|nr:prepilin-type N-terminal cleavage/methylation domain-containing protein [Lachnospiraceae bacterium]
MNSSTQKGQLNKAYRKNPNAGFSLVELLIAVTILAIIVAPLLHMFVTSTRINVKSRQTLRATTVAQDIMEGLKAYTLEEVSAQFEPPEGVSGDVFHYPSDGFYIVNSSMIQGGVRDLTEDMDGHVEGDEIYYFGIENLKMQGAEYDALIRLDASTYGANSKKIDASGTVNNPGGVHDREFNGKFYAEIGSVAEINGGGDEDAMKTDSSYHESKKLSEAVLKDVKLQIADDIAAVGGTLPDDWDDLKLEDIVTKRTIEIVLEDGGNDRCKATINFTYDCSYTYGETTYTYTSNGYDGSEGGKVVDVTRTFSSGNFYLFYYPIYKSGLVDNIQFKIKDAAKLCDKEQPLLKSITLAKQIRSVVDVDANVIAPDLTDAELWAKETAYRALVDVGADTSMDGNLTFRTNADTNMIKNQATGERDLISGVLYTYNANISHNVNQCTFSGNTTSDKVTNIIYDVEITVYQTGAAKHFTESNFEDNDEVHRLATITNMNQ